VHSTILCYGNGLKSKTEHYHIITPENTMIKVPKCSQNILFFIGRTFFEEANFFL